MNMEILDDFSGSNDQTIVKGKRTKRLRPSSSTSSSGGGGGGGGEFHCNSLAQSSPTTSTSTEEEEDMANCLILLARGGISPQLENEIKKENSRKFTQMATTTIGKVGVYVYECKTCSRTFPSFQALGGHRASHKKPKPAADVDQKKSPPSAAAPPSEEEEDEKFTQLNTIASSPSTHLSNHVDQNKPKIHECSICGSEFASGQALGGHMRRHRAAMNGGTTTRSGDDYSGEKTRNMLELDLNLPAPPEDDRRETEFPQFFSQLGGAAAARLLRGGAGGLPLLS